MIAKHIFRCWIILCLAIIAGAILYGIVSKPKQGEQTLTWWGYQ